MQGKPQLKKTALKYLERRRRRIVLHKHFLLSVARVANKYIQKTKKKKMKISLTPNMN